MDLGPEIEGGGSWALPENLVRRLWKIGKLAEWAGWNSKWRARCCQICGGPESYRKHAEDCSLAEALLTLERMYPEVTRALPLDPIQEIEAKEIERLIMGEIEDGARGPSDEPRNPDSPFWRE